MARYLWLSLLLPAVVVALAACQDDEDSDGNGSQDPPGFSMGVTYSPANWPDDTTTQEGIDFFEGHTDYGNLIAYHISWRDSQETAGEIPEVAQTAVAARDQFGIEFAIGFGWYNEATGPNLASDDEPGNNTWTNASTRQAFREMVTQFCQEHQPRFIFLGNETNMYYLRELDLPAEQNLWDAWMSQLEECYAAIKAVSPETTVLTVFQYEMVHNSGSNVAWTYPENWHLIEAFDSNMIDAIGFTTYPYLEYDDPADVPQDYYTQVEEYWDGPVIFTEVAWSPTAFAGTLAKQADWIGTFFELIAELDVPYVTYAFLHDPPDGVLNPAFEDIGLRSNDGSVIRPADGVWRNEAAARTGN